MSNFFDTDGQAGKIISFFFTKIILTWQFLVLIALIFLLPTIKNEFARLTKFKGKGFEVNFEQAAIFQGVDDTTVQKLKRLDADAFQVFLVKGGPNGDKIIPEFGFLDSANFNRINKLLDTLHLLALDSVKWLSRVNNWFYYNHTTAEGVSLHNAIVSAVYKTFAKKDDE